MAESRKVGAFAPYEWMLALRYLRAKRQESFVSVISGFSLVGIALGVATLIIVMSVMGGFRKEFLDSILGFNGHVTIEAQAGYLPDYDAMAARLRQVMATQNGLNTGVVVRGVRPNDLASLTLVAKSLTPGALANFGTDDTVII